MNELHLLVTDSDFGESISNCNVEFLLKYIFARSSCLLEGHRCDFLLGLLVY